MRKLLRRLILWACPEMTSLTAGLTSHTRLDGLVCAAKLIPGSDVRGEEASRLVAVTSPSGAHANHIGRAGIPGAHVWVLAMLALGSFYAPIKCNAQQGGQTSSVPPLTGSGAPSGNCGVGSMYVNTTTGDLYDCNAGSWLKVNGGGSGAFSGGLGASFQDATEIAAPANPGAGNDRLYLSSATHLLVCLTSSGANCMPAGGAGTVTQVTSGNFSPLFNVSVATNTTTPAFSFAGISQTQNLFFSSPNGASGNPSFRAMVAADVPASANSCATHQFTISLAVGLSVTCAQPVAADIGSIPGSSGQLLFNNLGAIGAEDPIVSYAYANLLNAAAATATQTSTITRVSTFSGYGTLYVTLGSLAGTYTSCTVQLKNADSLGNLINNGSAIALTMSNGVATFGVTSAAGLQTTAQIQAVYSCSAYGTAGTISVDYVPGVSVGLVGTPNVNIQSNASVNVAQVGGTAVVADPCQANTKTRFTVNLTASGQIITGTSAKKTYICDMILITSTAQNIALVEGTGTNCATGCVGMSGGATAATGWNFAANQGYTFGGGNTQVFSADSAAADNIYLLLSGTGQTSGSGHYVQQ